jgi:hypothetical protein
LDTNKVRFQGLQGYKVDALSQKTSKIDLFLRGWG